MQFFIVVSVSDCTSVNTFTYEDFRVNFCSGLLGQQDLSLDHQCQISTGWSGSTACNVSRPIASKDLLKASVHVCVLWTKGRNKHNLCKPLAIITRVLEGHKENFSIQNKFYSTRTVQQTDVVQIHIPVE